MRQNWFVQGLITNAAWALVAFLMLAILARYGSVWEYPVLIGLGGAALMSITVLSIKAVGRLPVRREVVSIDNVEREVRQWLDNFRVAVQNDPIPEAYFRFIVTMPAGTKIIVGRLRQDFGGYIILRSEITPSSDEQKMITSLPPNDAAALISDIRLEMARAKINFTGLGLPITTIAIFKRIPISESLTEDTFINKLDEVEAAVTALGIISYNGFRRHNMLSNMSIAGPPTAKLDSLTPQP